MNVRYIMYGKVIGNQIIYAPKYFEIDNTVINNFNENTELMLKYGYKQIIEIIPKDYDKEKHKLFIMSKNEDKHSIKIIYGKYSIEKPKDDYTLVLEEQKRLRESQESLQMNQVMVEEILLDTDYRLLQLEIQLDYGGSQ